MRFRDSINISHGLANTSLNIAVEEEGENCKSLFSARGGMRQLRCNTHCAAVGVGRARDLNGEITVLHPLPSANGRRTEGEAVGSDQERSLQR